MNKAMDLVVAGLSLIVLAFSMASIDVAYPALGMPNGIVEIVYSVGILIFFGSAFFIENSEE